MYNLHVPHTAFPDATKATTKATTNEVHVTKDRGIRTSHKIVGGPRQQVSIQPKRKTVDKKERGPHNPQLIRKQKKKLKFGFV